MIAVEKSGVYPVPGTSLVLDKNRMLYKFCSMTNMPRANEDCMEYFRFEGGVATSLSNRFAQIFNRPENSSQPFADLYPVLVSYLPLHPVGVALQEYPWRIVTKEELEKGKFTEPLFEYNDKEAASEPICVEVTVNGGQKRFLIIDLAKPYYPLTLMAEYVDAGPSPFLHYSMRILENKVGPEGVVTPVKWEFVAYSGMFPPAIPAASFDCVLESAKVNEPQGDHEFELPTFKVGTIIADHRDPSAPKHSIMTREGIKEEPIEEILGSQEE